MPSLIDANRQAELVRNVATVLASATDAEWRSGRGWYRRFNREIRTITHDAGLWTNSPTLRRAIGVTAALSPQRSPRSNLTLLKRFLDDQLAGRQPDKLYSTRTQHRKSLAVWSGADPESTLTGPKESEFFRAISGDPNAVVIDGHAWSIAMGERITTDNAKVPKSGPRLTAVKQAYRTVAHRHKLPASEVQAITWLAWRRQWQDAKTRKQNGSDVSDYL